MRLRPGFWLVLSLLLFAAALCLWQAGDRRAASRRALALAPASSGKSVPSVPSAPAVPAPPKTPRSYRLSNTPQTAAQLARNPHGLLLRNALIDTARPVALGVPEALRSHGAPGSYLVQSDRPLNGEFYAALRRDGAEFVSFMPVNAALVRAGPEAAKAMVADRVFQAVLPYEPYFKLDSSLLPGAVNGDLLTNNELWVTVFPGQGEAAGRALTALGAVVTEQEPGLFGASTLRVTVPPGQLAAVAQLPQAQEIEASSPRHLLNDLTRERLEVATDTIALTNYLGLTGSNMVLVLDDTGVDATHPDLGPAGRVTGNLPSALTDPNGHGTHVAGTMVGGGNESASLTNPPPGSVAGASFRGMAPQAGLYVQGVDLTTGPYISDAYLQSNASFVLSAMAAANTAMVSNGFINCLPWGYQSTAYDLPAASYDLATRNSQPGTAFEHPMLFVVAAGNGAQAPGSITSPGTAKNVITVTAMDSPRFITNLVDFGSGTNDPIFQSTTYDSNQVAGFSSAGNVDVGIEGGSGRFKPDVAAPGSFTVSLRATNYQDPVAQQTLSYNEFAGQSVPPGQSNVYAVTIFGGTTNLAIQLLPNPFSPVPFPTNLQIYFDTNDPPLPASLLPAAQTNAAGVPVVPYPPATNCFVEIYNPAGQPWPVAYDLRFYALETNSLYTNYYQVLSNLNSGLGPYYRYESGTSMAAAAVAGMLALVQEFLNTTYQMSPSPALLKGLLINGSRPLNAQSDLNMAPAVNLEGWGLPNLANSIPASLTNGSASLVFFDQSPTNALQTGQWHQYTINLADTNAQTYPLRITLVWTDPPGNPAAGLALVNNLDLLVTHGTETNAFVGNDFLQGDIYTEVTLSTNVLDQMGLSTNAAVNNLSDVVNNVENVYINPGAGLTPTYTVWVRGTRVNVNAVTSQTNVIGQDYALVIASDDPALTVPLTVTDLGTSSLPPVPLVTVANNGVALLHQRVGANEPNLAEYPGGGLYPAPGSTNGSLVQWHFFLFTNVNYNTTNSSLTNSAGTNIATNYTNAIFATFLPPTLTVPISSPVNGSYQAAINADLDLYVSTNPALFNLDPAALAGANKSLGQGGNETVFFTNISSVPVFYAGVKSESQQGGDFAFFATLATNFDSPNGLNPITVSGYPLPATIPDSMDPGGLQGTNVLAFVASPITVRKVAATVGVQHSNPSDLYGTLTHNAQQSVPNHFTGAPGGFTNTYDDLPDGSLANTIASDGPPTLRNFIGLPGNGQWILNEADNLYTQTGMVTVLTLTIWPQPVNPLDFVIGSLAPNASYYGYVDVPDDATNLNIAVGFQNGGPLGIFLTNQQVVNTGDYGTNISLPGGSLNLSTNPALNLLTDPLPAAPPLSGGRWYYDITNEGGTTVTNIQVVITILESGTPNLTLTEFNNTLTPLGTDDHTLSQICIPAGSILASNQQLVSLEVGVRIAKTNSDNLVLHLTSPQGTSVELYEDRGGPGVTNLGLTTSNGSYIYLTFTDNTNFAQQLVKFVPPPYGQIPTNVDLFISSFETVPAGPYGLTNGLFPVTLGTNVEGWTVVSNQVAVVTGSDLYQAYEGTNYMALADGYMTNSIPTIIGQPYTLTYAYRGPGLVDWWPFEGDANDIIGTNNGIITPTVTNITGVVGQGFQFDGQGSHINFGPNAGNFGTNDFTIDFWMNTTSVVEEAFLDKRDICNLGTWWNIRIGLGNPTPTPGIVSLELDDGTGPGHVSFYPTNLVNDGLWHHVAWTRRGTLYSAYVDGRFKTSVTAPDIANLNNAQPLNLGIGTCDGVDGTQPYSGAVDELDLWNRALTDVEIAAIYQAGTNHIGKANPTSILPNCEILLNGLTNTTLIAPASSTNWLTNAVYFTAVSSNTVFALEGHPLGMLFDDFVLQTPATPNFVQPEEALAPFTGQNPDGCWTLDVWDTRTDATAVTNGVLLSWNLQMTVSSTNVNLIVLTNHVPYTAGTVAANDIAYFAFDVPAGAILDTNRLRNCLSNGLAGFPAELNLLFNQTALPTGDQSGDYTLLTNVSTGFYELSNNAPPPSLLPGARYFLGVQNPNTYPATFTVQVDTQNLTNFSAIPLTNTIAFTNTITNTPQFYSFDVPTNAILASFEIINPANELDLYARHDLPLPTSAMFDYKTSYEGTNDEAIVVATNSFDLLGFQVTTNSAPVPLTPGTWYLAVYNFNANSTNTYRVVASFITNGAITITPLTNFLNGAWQANGTIGPGPDLTNFYSYTVTNPAASAVQFVASNLTGNVDLIARIGFLPTPLEMTDGSFSPGITPQQVTIVTNALLPSFVGTTWYLGVPNNTAQTVSFTITATTLTNGPPLYTTPAIVFSAMSAGANGFTFSWTAGPGAAYEVDMSSDLIHWSKAATVTTDGYVGAYTDPTPIGQQTARFYKVIRTQ